MLRATVVLCGLLLGILVAAIVWSSGHGNLFGALQRMANEPWAVVTLLDLGVGLLFVAGWIAMMEPRRLHAAGWIVALLLLGNVVTMVFLIWRSRYARHFSDLFLPHHRSDRTRP